MTAITASAVIATTLVVVVLWHSRAQSSTTLESVVPLAPVRSVLRQTADQNASAGPLGSNNKESDSARPNKWALQFRQSDDYLQFVKAALPAALSGDGRAAWYIADALSSCSLVMETYRGSADPDGQLNQELANMPKAPQWMRNLNERKTRRCLGLARENPFDTQPHNEGMSTSAHWRALALAAGDAVAQSAAVGDILSTISISPDMTSSTRQEKVQSAEKYIRAAVESGDADALYNVGGVLINPKYSVSPQNALAVTLAACQLGRDCSADNPENVFYNCKLSGGCPSDADYSYYLEQSLGPDTYAEVYARAQQIVRAVESKDWDTVLANLKLSSQPR